MWLSIADHLMMDVRKAEGSEKEEGKETKRQTDRQTARQINS